MSQRSPDIQARRHDDDHRLPCFLDVEASGFGPESFPIEVAWSDPAGHINRRLIDPSAVPGWTQWSPDAQAVHGLDRSCVERHGSAPVRVADLLAQDLSDQAVYSDAPEFDEQWLQRLFAAVGRAIPFRIRDVDDLLLPMLRQDDEMVYQAVLRLEERKVELEADRRDKHSAGHDVAWLRRLWQRCRSDSQRFRAVDSAARISA